MDTIKRFFLAIYTMVNQWLDAPITPITPSPAVAMPAGGKPGVMRIFHLKDLTPKEIRKIAADYQLKVTGYAGNRWRRAVLLFLPCAVVLLLAALLGFFNPFGYGILVWLLAVMIVGVSDRASFLLAFLFAPPIAAIWALYSLIDNDIIFWMLTTIVAGIWSFIATWGLWKLFLVNTPKLGAIITRNIFTGRMHVLKPGLGIIFPWEDLNYEYDVISQRAKKVEIKEGSKFLVKGVTVTYKWTAQWAPFLPLLPLNIRFSEDDVAEAVIDIVENTISEELLELDNIDDVLDPEKVGKIQMSLLQAMEGHETKKHHCDAFGNSVEERVGANMEISTLGPPDLAPDYKQALVVSKTADMMTAKAEEMALKLKIEGGEAMENVMMLNREPDVKKNVLEIRVGKGLEQVAEHAGRIMAAADKIASRIPPADGGKK